MILRRSTLFLAATALLVACGTDSSTTEPTATTAVSAEATESTAVSAEAAESTAVSGPLPCEPEAFITGDLGDPVVEFCDGSFAKVNQSGTGMSIVFQAVDGDWDIYPQHGMEDDGSWCYSPEILVEDGASPELQELIPLCSG